MMNVVVCCLVSKVCCLLLSLLACLWHLAKCELLCVVGGLRYVGSVCCVAFMV